jgi:hypothetical protein
MYKQFSCKHKTENTKWFLKSFGAPGRWWLTPVILATQEAEIRRITVRSQPRLAFETLSQKNLLQKIGLVEWLTV